MPVRGLSLSKGRGRHWLAASVAGALLCAATPPVATPAFAASPITKAFLANLVPNVDFLDRSSRFALANSKNARLKEFARSEAREQTLAANALDEWMETDGKAAPALSARNLDRTPTGSVKPRAGAVAARTDSAPAADDRLPMGQEDLDRLEGMDGAEFDALYKEKQLDALHQIETDYRDYIGRGDVAALKALASRELPKIKRRLVRLGKL